MCNPLTALRIFRINYVYIIFELSRKTCFHFPMHYPYIVDSVLLELL